MPNEVSARHRRRAHSIGTDRHSGGRKAGPACRRYVVQLALERVRRGRRWTILGRSARAESPRMASATMASGYELAIARRRRASELETPAASGALHDDRRLSELRGAALVRLQAIARNADRSCLVAVGSWHNVARVRAANRWRNVNTSRLRVASRLTAVTHQLPEDSVSCAQTADAVVVSKMPAGQTGLGQSCSDNSLRDWHTLDAYAPPQTCVFTRPYSVPFPTTLHPTGPHLAVAPMSSGPVGTRSDGRKRHERRPRR
jgi:hypothetical protein